MKTDSDTCLHCGQTREAIKRRKMFCATVTNTESGMETDYEWPRHRFTPYSVKELASIKADEDEYIKQMGEMAIAFKEYKDLPTNPTE